MPKLSTVNVVQLDDNGNVSSVRSWADTPEGIKEAEKTFVQIIKDHTSETAYEPEELQAMIDEGVCDEPSVGTKLFIILGV